MWSDSKLFTSLSLICKTVLLRDSRERMLVKQPPSPIWFRINSNSLMVPQDYSNVESMDSSWLGLNLVILTLAPNCCVRHTTNHMCKEGGIRQAHKWSKISHSHSETSRNNTGVLSISFLTWREIRGETDVYKSWQSLPYTKKCMCFSKSLGTPFTKVDRQTILMICRITSDVFQMMALFPLDRKSVV